MQLTEFAITQPEKIQLLNFISERLYQATELTTLDKKVFQSLQNKLYGQAKHMGWHDTTREVGTLIALCHSELSEAFDGYIHGKMDDHLPEYQMRTVELADTVIRIFDFAGSQNIDLVSAMNEVNKNYTWGDGESFNDNLLHLHLELSNALEGARKNKNSEEFPEYKQLDIALASCVLSIFGTANQFNLRVIEAIHDKHAYNAVRADHQKVNREKVGGKAF